MILRRAHFVLRWSYLVIRCSCVNPALVDYILKCAQDYLSSYLVLRWYPVHLFSNDIFSRSFVDAWNICICTSSCEHSHYFPIAHPASAMVFLPPSQHQVCDTTLLTCLVVHCCVDFKTPLTFLSLSFLSHPGFYWTPCHFCGSLLLLQSGLWMLLPPDVASISMPNMRCSLEK
jgi:hypothetical protein